LLEEADLQVSCAYQFEDETYYGSSTQSSSSNEVECPLIGYSNEKRLEPETVSVVALTSTGTIKNMTSTPCSSSPTSAFFSTDNLLYFTNPLVVCGVEANRTLKVKDTSGVLAAEDLQITSVSDITSSSTTDDDWTEFTGLVEVACSPKVGNSSVEWLSVSWKGLATQLSVPVFIVKPFLVEAAVATEIQNSSSVEFANATVKISVDRAFDLQLASELDSNLTCSSSGE